MFLFAVSGARRVGADEVAVLDSAPASRARVSETGVLFDEGTR